MAAVTRSRVIANTYRDSVALMQLSATLVEAAGVEQASAVMATAGNLELLREGGLDFGATEARASDVLVAVRAKTDAIAAATLDRAAAMLAKTKAVGTGDGPAAIVPCGLTMAAAQSPGANLALVSVPGEYAGSEAARALEAGLNVMLFSDNVSLEDEVALKARAAERGLLVMGPDCGTAIIDGVPLAFANSVRRGPVGAIGASGTGLQQVTSLIDQAGVGISQAIGTGGRDLSDAVGGRTTLAALELLSRDKDTKVIVLIGKPPGADTAKQVLAAAGKLKKPVVVNFIGADIAVGKARNLHVAATLEDAAAIATALASGRSAAVRRASIRLPRLPRLAATQRFVRGLYSGGTFCYEASMLLGDLLEAPVWSNASVRGDRHLDDPRRSRGHTLVDLGDDMFTRGRPHPMIDQRLRNERIVQEAGDPSVAVILLDVVLGHGSHPDPASAIAPAIAAARAKAAKGKRKLVFVGFVCGTNTDPQHFATQQATLADAGMVLARSNAQAVRMAARIVAL